MTTTRRLCGEREFRSNLTITDPCYDDDVWCVKRMKIIPGIYECYVYEHDEHWTSEDGKTHSYRINDAIEIELKSAKYGAKYIPCGSIGVDAGLAGFFNDKPNYNDKEWFEFCDRIKDGSAFFEPEGFFGSSGHGDGVYDVLCKKDTDGNVWAVKIEFFDVI